ncbi:glycosyltransferase [Streptomyces sp. SID14478]|uniref:glycosyltransferase n=1 Tax=Streptomyces sp. SID14478 TaxID=2706073 RepID=UPI0013E05B38|nr:glycosyltransferase [Streptomyces sp. SID14478]
MKPSAIAVVVPAHNEEHRIGACLRSVREAAAQVVPVPVVTVVAADACTDDTAGTAARHGAHVVQLDRRNVGAARAVGTAYALHLLRPWAPHVWLAMTDADSTVPGSWLTVQMRWAQDGYDMVLGTIRLAAPTPRLLALHDAAYFRTRPLGAVPHWDHPHVHGANLGLSASAYVEVGGFASLPTGEDHELVSRLVGRGRRIARSDRHPVRTAARLRGRAPGGLAELLTGLHWSDRNSPTRAARRPALRPDAEAHQAASSDVRTEPTSR